MRPRVSGGTNAPLQGPPVRCNLALHESGSTADVRPQRESRLTQMPGDHTRDHRVLLHLRSGLRLLRHEQLRQFSAGTMDHLLPAVDDGPVDTFVLRLDLHDATIPPESVVLLVAEDQQRENRQFNAGQYRSHNRSITNRRVLSEVEQWIMTDREGLRFRRPAV